MPAPTDLAAALLRDVLIRGRIYTGGNCLNELVCKKDVLAALSRALDAATAERAGGIVSELREVAAVFTKDTVFTDAADLITALLTANAALRAERDRYLRHLTTGAESLNAYKARAEAAEAAAQRDYERLVRSRLPEIEALLRGIHSAKLHSTR